MSLGLEHSSWKYLVLAFSSWLSLGLVLDFNFELWMGQRRGWNLALGYKLGLQRSSGSSEMRQRGLANNRTWRWQRAF